MLPHHHIRVNSEMRQDLQLWNTFLAHPSVFCRPFMDFKNTLEADMINFYTEASGNCKFGMGGRCNQSWFMQMWETEFIEKCKPSIEYLELYADTVGILLWIKRFSNKRVILFCDNISIVQMLNKSTSSCKNCMVLIRLITPECLYRNTRVYAKYVKSEENRVADALSRGQLSRFKLLTRFDSMKEHPDVLPEAIWPMSKIWVTHN